MSFRPCIDLYQGEVRQIVGRTLSKKEGPIINFSATKPVEWFVDLYKKDNLTDGHIVLLGDGNDETALKAVRRWQGSFQVGGQMNEENASFWLDNGAKKIIFTSWIFEKEIIHWDRLERLAEKIGCEKIVLDISCQQFKDDYYIMTEHWENRSKHALSQLTEKLADYCAEFLIHATSVEGRKKGIEKKLISVIANYKRPPKITYAGGIASRQDIEYIQKTGKGRLFFTIGSALDIFGGDISYEWVVRNFKSKEKP